MPPSGAASAHLITMRPVKYTHAIVLVDGLEACDRRACRLEYKRIASTAMFDDHAAASAVVEPLDAGDEIVVPETSIEEGKRRVRLCLRACLGVIRNRRIRRHCAMVAKRFEL